MIKVKDIYNFIGELSPYEFACEWDNCGLLVGDSDKEVKRIGVCLDATNETLQAAIDIHADVIVTHHPIIFASQKSFTKGNPAFEAASNGISVISAHTCFDCAKGGVNDVLCDILNIKNTFGLLSHESKEPMARIGFVDTTTVEVLASEIAMKLETVCRIVKGNKPVNKVAVCGGSAFDFFFDAVRLGADTYITGEVKHHELLIAKDMGINLIVAGHYETEKPAMFVLKNKLSERFKETEVVMLDESNPVEFIG